MPKARFPVYKRWVHSFGRHKQLGGGGEGGVFEMHVNEWPQTTRVSLPLLLCIHKVSIKLDGYRIENILVNSTFGCLFAVFFNFPFFIRP